MRKSCMRSITIFAIVFGLIIVGGGNTAFAQESNDGDGDTRYDSHPYFQADDTGDVEGAMYDRHYNTTSHDVSVWNLDEDIEVKNNITVDAMVRDVTYESGDQVIRVAVNAYGDVEERGDYYHEGQQDYWQHLSTKSTEIHAELGSNAPDDAMLGLDKEYNRRGIEDSESIENYNDIGGEEGDDDFWTDAAQTGMGEFAGRVPIFGEFYTVSEFMTEHYGLGGSWKVESDAGYGPGAHAGQAFRTRPNIFPELGNEDEVDGRHFFYTASTQFTISLPGQIPDEMSISLSAKNLIGYWEGGQNWANEDGAEASVEIPIKNRKIESVDSYYEDIYGAESKKRNAVDELHHFEEITVGVNRPNFESGWGKSGWGKPEVPRMDLTVDWAANRELYSYKDEFEDIRPYKSVQIGDTPFWANIDRTHGVGFKSIDHSYDLDELGMDVGDEKTIKVEITAELHDAYGGWEESISYEFTVERIEEYPWPGPGPGPGPIPTSTQFDNFTSFTSPYPYPYPSETTPLKGMEEWKFEADDSINSSAIIGMDDNIYVGSEDGNLYALDQGGTERWSFETGGSVRSSPAIDKDNTIYVGSTDHNLYALNPDGSEK